MSLLLNRIINAFLILKPTRFPWSNSAHWIGALLSLAAYGFSWKGLVLWICFFLCYGAIYTANDLMDYEHDKNDPLRSRRLIASGKVPFMWALTQTLILFIVTVSVATYLSAISGGLLIALIVLNFTYTVFLKKLAYIDYLVISLSHIGKFLLGVCTFCTVSILAVPFVTVPVLAVIYSISVTMHSQKQLLRILQDRKKTFWIGSYSVEGLVITYVLGAVGTLILASTSLDGLFMYMGIVLGIFNLVFLVSLLSTQVRKAVIKLETLTSIV